MGKNLRPHGVNFKFKLVMSIRRKVAKGEVDFCIERMLFIFVMDHSSHRSYTCTRGLVLIGLQSYLSLVTKYSLNNNSM